MFQDSTESHNWEFLLFSKLFTAVVKRVGYFFFLRKKNGEGERWLRNVEKL